MINTPVFGFEKPYLENIKKAIAPNICEAFEDDFGNLITKKGRDSQILIGISISENAFLVTEITDNGLVKFSPLKPEEFLIHQKVTVNKKTGFICDEDTIDFGFKDKKAVSKFIKAGDMVNISHVIENCGDSYFTNSKCCLLKNIILDIIKNSNTDIAYAFLREGKKGGYALGKNLKMDIAYFITLLPDSKEAACFLKKEGDFISDMNLSPAAVSKDELSVAGSYYLAGGSRNTIGVGLRCQKLKNGYFKVYKDDIKELIKLLGVG